MARKPDSVTKRILLAAYAVVFSKGGWTRHDSARDAHGNVVKPSDPSAVCFCSTGGIEFVTNARNGKFYRAKAAVDNATRDGIIFTNDGFGREAARRAFVRAIARA